jgi:hypothetical protein
MEIREDNIINEDGKAFDGRIAPLFVAAGFSIFLLIGAVVALFS